VNKVEYQDKLHKMQRLHSDLDQTFLDVNKVIPYDRNNDDVYSPRYVFILQDASRQVDGMFKLLYYQVQALLAAHGSPQLPLRRYNFIEFYNFLNKKKMLEVQKVAPLEDVSRILTPFQLKKQNTPQWWQAYNDTKHDLPEGDTFGKLGFALEALGAVAILHDIAQAFLYEKAAPDRTLDSANWSDNETRFLEEYERTKFSKFKSAVSDHTALEKTSRTSRQCSFI
jgi:hypothetical protein